MKKGKPKARGKAKAVRRAPVLPPPPEPYVPNWGEVNPDFYEDLLEWVDTIEID